MLTKRIIPCLDVRNGRVVKGKKFKDIVDVDFPEVLGKVMWKVYYEKPYTDLCGRLFNKPNICGIYKITNINNKMCYVG